MAMTRLATAQAEAIEAALPRIRELLAGGMSQRDTARAVGLSANTVRRVTSADYDGRSNSKMQEERRLRAIELRRQGRSVREVARALDMSTNSVIRYWREAKQADPSLRDLGLVARVSPEQVTEIVRLVREGLGRHQIAAQLGLSASAVWKRAKAAMREDPTLRWGTKPGRKPGAPQPKRPKADRKPKAVAKPKERAAVTARSALKSGPDPRQSVPLRAPAAPGQPPLLRSARDLEQDAIDAAIAAGKGRRFERPPATLFQALATTADVIRWAQAHGMEIEERRSRKAGRQAILYKLTRDGEKVGRKLWSTAGEMNEIVRQMALADGYKAVPLREVYGAPPQSSLGKSDGMGLG